MLAFEILFPISMILFPLVYVIFVRKDDGADHGDCRRSFRRLLNWTGVSLAAFTLVIGTRLFLESASGQDARQWIAMLRPLERVSHFAFFPLWFLLAAPAIHARRPNLTRGSTVAGTVRSASLAPRPTVPGLSPRASWLPVILWVLGASVCALGLSKRVFEGPSPTPYVILLLALAALAMLAAPTLRRGLISEPEPMDAQHSPELIDAYAGYRKAKASGLYALAITMQVAQIAAAIVFAYGVHENAGIGSTLGLIGAITGSLIGIGGGIFGSVMGHRRMKIQELLGRLRAQQSDEEGSTQMC